MRLLALIKCEGRDLTAQAFSDFVIHLVAASVASDPLLSMIASQPPPTAAEGPSLTKAAPPRR